MFQSRTLLPKRNATLTGILMESMILIKIYSSMALRPYYFSFVEAGLLGNRGILDSDPSFPAPSRPIPEMESLLFEILPFVPWEFVIPPADRPTERSDLTRTKSSQT
jgi:hypothetical protein